MLRDYEYKIAMMQDWGREGEKENSRKSVG
jgi:hypothetical protein